MAGERLQMHESLSVHTPKLKGSWWWLEQHICRPKDPFRVNTCTGHDTEIYKFLSLSSASSYTNTFLLLYKPRFIVSTNNAAYRKRNKWFQCCVEGSLYTKTSGSHNEGRACHYTKHKVCRKGVKACVILERGAKFKFPDDGYFNALDFLPCNPSVQGRKRLIVLYNQPLIMTSQTSEGKAGISGK